MIALMKNSEKMFDKFSFGDIIGSEVTDKKHESVENATTNKKADSDSKVEENNHLQKQRHLKQEEKLRHQMKIAELKQICSWPDIVEAYIEKEESKMFKQKQRECMQPKTGKMDI